MNKSRRNARGEATLKALLAETATLVSRYGFAGTTIARITKGTGKPASSIYWFFPTKDELVAAALEGTYRHSVENFSAWPEFDASLTLRHQLAQILTPSFTSSKYEGAVRLGIMVVLEGSSEGSPAREPFRLRRQRARKQLHAWWTAATVAHTDELREEIAEKMVQLSIAFLDGHYISDVLSDEAPQTQRGELVAAALCGAFHELLASRATLQVPQDDQASMPESNPTTSTDSRDILLTSTCSLVAERSYEGATLSLIGERAGMQRSSIYWRYKGKDELIRDAVAEPFLRLARTTIPGPSTASGSLRGTLAKSIVESVAASGLEPDAVKAGLLLKLQRREPLSLSSEAIQQGLIAQEKALTQWIESATESRATVDAAILVWMVNVLKEGLMLGVAFGYNYDIKLLEKVCLSMIDSVLKDSVLNLAGPRI